MQLLIIYCYFNGKVFLYPQYPPLSPSQAQVPPMPLRNSYSHVAYCYSVCFYLYADQVVRANQLSSSWLRRSLMQQGGEGLLVSMLSSERQRNRLFSGRYEWSSTPRRIIPQCAEVPLLVEAWLMTGMSPSEMQAVALLAEELGTKTWKARNQPGC